MMSSKLAVTSTGEGSNARTDGPRERSQRTTYVFRDRLHRGEGSARRQHIVGGYGQTDVATSDRPRSLETTDTHRPCRSSLAQETRFGGPRPSFADSRGHGGRREGRGRQTQHRLNWRPAKNKEIASQCNAEVHCVTTAFHYRGKNGLGLINADRKRISKGWNTNSNLNMRFEPRKFELRLTSYFRPNAHL